MLLLFPSSLAHFAERTPNALTNYAFFGRTDAGFRSTMFHSALKAVQDAAARLREEKSDAA